MMKAPEPYYANYNGFANHINVKVVAVPSTIEAGFALPSIEKFEKKITPRTKAILICSQETQRGIFTQRRVEKIG